jgi:hypothetical protein
MIASTVLNLFFIPVLYLLVERAATAGPGAQPPVNGRFRPPAPVCGRFARNRTLLSGVGGRMAATLWFYVRDDKRQGPVDFEHLVTMLLAGQIPHNALVGTRGCGSGRRPSASPRSPSSCRRPCPWREGHRRLPLSVVEPGTTHRRYRSDSNGFTSGCHRLTRRSRPASRSCASAWRRNPGSRLFAQLAEELRKDGQLEEAISVLPDRPAEASETIRQPASPWPARSSTAATSRAARTELEAVLQGSAGQHPGPQAARRVPGGPGGRAGRSRRRGAVREVVEVVVERWRGTHGAASCGPGCGSARGIAARGVPWPAARGTLHTASRGRGRCSLGA